MQDIYNILSFPRLANALTKIDQFNEEETSFGWELSQYPKRKAIYDRIVPYKKLYDAGYEFLDKYNTWMTSRVRILINKFLNRPLTVRLKC